MNRQTHSPQKKAVIIVLDGVGCGALPDAADYGDSGADTLGNIARAVGGLCLPNLQAAGLGNIHPILGVPPADKPTAFHGRMAEISSGKDSTTGHWELMGIHRKIPPQYYPDGFPPEVVRRFREATGRDMLGNRRAEGIGIIRELGDEHLCTGSPIVYTSADSVFQIAAHTDVISQSELYDLCRAVRERVMNGSPYNIDRIIARPFEGETGNFRRTPGRRDFSVPPPEISLIDIAVREGVRCFGVGKVDYLFANRGFENCLHTVSNADGVQKTLDFLCQNSRSHDKMILLVNLVDFDQAYGHRNDIAGFAASLEAFDTALPSLLRALGEQDILAVTADHGCDPVSPGTDHTREYAPLLLFGESLASPQSIGERKSFADLAATLAEFFHLPPPPHGDSFHPILRGAQ